MTGVHVWLRVGTEHYAVPIESVRQVDELGAVSAVPGAGGALLGLRNLQGQVLPVFELARVLGIAADDSTRGPQRVVVAEQAGRLAGLGVDEVTDVGALDAELEETDAAYLSATVLDEGRLVGIVDVENLFAALAEAAA
jgi:chemotaxis signal transduction protein